jgi:hypothetical protein
MTDDERSSRRRRRLLMVTYLAAVSAFCTAYIAYMAGANGYHHDAWAWGVSSMVCAVVACLALWRAR